MGRRNVMVIFALESTVAYVLGGDVLLTKMGTNVTKGRTNYDETKVGGRLWDVPTNCQSVCKLSCNGYERKRDDATHC
ncbi:Hypothetical protein NTJ_04758 [Nesidiocoris tenuis]|uniref:Uncharacterized protein n=1 Tax=Nesidiocoris tenuis TaxID=355587 RepID=A0ABN7AM19_9HEMI|nr:Hypothetical protein NTJ_04758 [Nesidiocoris tenuis]